MISDPGTPTLDQLKVLLTVVEVGSFAGAARKLHRATSVVSYAISNLEVQLGVSLFDRKTTRKPQLTEAGRTVLAEARTIINGVNGKKYDIGISSFTINDERKKQVNMVSYFSAGTQWASAEGNPKGVDPENACGKTIAVQTGTVQDTDDLPARQKACGSDKIEVLRYKDQGQATSAVVSGKADAMLADSPVVAYAVKQSGGKLAPLGEIYEAAPYGYVVPKAETEFADAIVEALQEIEKDGAYKSALEKWGVEDGAISDFAVNP